MFLWPRGLISPQVLEWRIDKSKRMCARGKAEPKREGTSVGTEACGSCCTALSDPDSIWNLHALAQPAAMVIWSWARPEGTWIVTWQCGMQEETMATISKSWNLCCAYYVLLRTRREQFDVGLEPNVSVCHGSGNRISVQQTLGEVLRLCICHLYNFPLKSFSGQTLGAFIVSWIDPLIFLPFGTSVYVCFFSFFALQWGLPHILWRLDWIFNYFYHIFNCQELFLMPLSH